MDEMVDRLLDILADKLTERLSAGHKELYTAKELAERYGVSCATIRSKMAAGEFGELVSVGERTRLVPQGVRGGGQEVKEAIRARCPLCGGEIIVSEYYQTSRDYKVLMNGKLSKRYIVTDAGPINSMTASCGSFCGAYWEHEEFDISEDGMFYDKKYLEEEVST